MGICQNAKPPHPASCTPSVAAPSSTCSILESADCWFCRSPSTQRLKPSIQPFTECRLASAYRTNPYAQQHGGTFNAFVSEFHTFRFKTLDPSSYIVLLAWHSQTHDSLRKICSLHIWVWCPIHSRCALQDQSQPIQSQPSILCGGGL